MKARYILLLSVLFLIQSCSIIRVFGPLDDDSVNGCLNCSNNFRRSFGLPQKDIYVWFNIVTNPEEAYKTLVSDSKRFADKKCGQNKPYKLVDYEFTPRSIKFQRPSIIHVNIKCGDNFPEKTKIDSRMECKNLGFREGTEKFKDCLKNL